jgi:membrane-bound lytic murein transglycosylase F
VKTGKNWTRPTICLLSSLQLLIFFAAALVSRPSYSAAPCSSRKFDAQIAAAVKRHWFDFRAPAYLKAQLCAESGLNPDAVSPVGAQGLGQFMPRTWQDTVRKLNWDGAFHSPFNPKYAIDAAAVYQGDSRTAWDAAGRTPVQRNDLGLCAYNAGLGNCLQAQTRCKGARLWPDIAPCMPAVTGSRAQETLTYVWRINNYAGFLTVRP